VVVVAAVVVVVDEVVVVEVESAVPPPLLEQATRLSSTIHPRRRIPPHVDRLSVNLIEGDGRLGGRPATLARRSGGTAPETFGCPPRLAGAAAGSDAQQTPRNLRNV
jgi:hypothetical protein